jgi:protein phosphatase
MSKLVVGCATDVGLVRANNQDQLLVCPGLYAVADGMGGHAAGEVASLTAVRTLRSAFESSTPRSADALAEAAKAANLAIWELARTNREMFGMGTTLVALAVVERGDGTNGLAVVHIGDSRVYLLRDGTLHQVTVDHSLVQELVDDGQISEAEAAVHPQRHVLTRALGVEPTAGVDLIDLSSDPGDRYLLCSDGLSREASDDQIASVLRRFANPSEAAKELVALAKSRGGSDNITVVVVDLLSDEDDLDGTIDVPEASLPLPSPSPGGRSRRNHNYEADYGTAIQPNGRRSPRLRARQERPAVPSGTVLRVTGFVVAICIVIGGGVAGLAYYARSAYFVGLHRGHLTIFQGRPGGVLWFDPTVILVTDVTKGSVLPFRLQALRAGQTEASVADAWRYIDRLVAAKKAAVASSKPQVTQPSVPASPTSTTGPVPSTTGLAVPTTSPTTVPSTIAARTTKG